MAEATEEKGARKRGAGRYAVWGLAGVGAAAALGAGYFLYREKSAERPRHIVVEQDGEFELRDYPDLIVAETKAAGGRDAALDHGFAELADYIFAKSRPGGKIAMTAPVLSTEAGDDWVTRFVMPAHLSREQLPQPPAGVTLTSVPARRVAVLAFNGPVDDAILAEREMQLRSWVGAKKLKVLGGAEHAFYNSPFMPAPLRLNEVLLPVG
jgi:hypothetical protein